MIALLCLCSSVEPLNRGFVGMEYYGASTYKGKLEYLSPNNLWVCVHTNFKGAETSLFTTVYFSCTEYLEGFGDLHFSYGVYMESEKEIEQYVTVKHAGLPEIEIPYDNDTISVNLTRLVLEAAVKLQKQYKEKLIEEADPEISRIKNEMIITEKLIKTAVDLADKRKNQERYRELEREYAQHIPRDKLERAKLKEKIKYSEDENEKEELLKQLEKLRENKTSLANFTEIDAHIKALKRALNKTTEYYNSLDIAQQRRRLYRKRRRMVREANKNTEEEEMMSNLYKGIGEITDDPKEKEEMDRKRRAFEKISEIKMRRNNKTEEYRRRRKREKDPLDLPKDEEEAKEYGSMYRYDVFDYDEEERIENEEAEKEMKRKKRTKKKNTKKANITSTNTTDAVKTSVNQTETFVNEEKANKTQEREFNHTMENKEVINQTQKNEESIREPNDHNEEVINPMQVNGEEISRSAENEEGWQIIDEEETTELTHEDKESNEDENEEKINESNEIEELDAKKTPEEERKNQNQENETSFVDL